MKVSSSVKNDVKPKIVVGNMPKFRAHLILLQGKVSTQTFAARGQVARRLATLVYAKEVEHV